MVGNEFNAVNDMEQAPTGGVRGLFAKTMQAQEENGKLLSPFLWAGYNNYRYQQTFLKGGFYDVTGGMTAPLSRGRAGRLLGRTKHRIFNSTSSMTATGQQASSFVGGRNIFGRATARGTKLVNSTGKVGSAKGYGLHYLNPRRVLSGRFSSASVFGSHHAGFYSPQGGGMLQGAGNFLGNSYGRARYVLGGNGFRGYQKQNYFEGGVTGRLGAVSKFERPGFSTGIRGARRVERAELTAKRVLSQNNAVSFAHFESMGMNMGDSGAMRWATKEGMRGSASKAFTERIFTSGGGEAMFSDAGRASERMFAGQLVKMTANAEKLASPLARVLESNPALANKAVSRGATRLAAGTAAEQAEYLSMQAVKKGMFKSFGASGVKELVAQGGSRFALAAGGEALLAAIPGVNLIFAADIALQLGKLTGAGIKAGINFGKDALKSVTGTMNNGIFGAGFKDNEVAATSRARGVQAIQNSRMNARSLLGAEGAMMASHFG